jgi:hypothetical protein
MSDPLSIIGFLRRLKSNVVEDGQSSHGSGVFARSKKRKVEEKKSTNDSEELFESPENEKIINLAQIFGLSRNETVEALDVLVKATNSYAKSLDISTLLLTNNVIKYPSEELLASNIPPKLLKEIEEKFPDISFAINNRFEFLCKYPKLVSPELFKKFTYFEVLDFSRRCPEEHQSISNLLKHERDDESD